MVHQRQTALAPRSPNRIGDGGVSRGVRAVAALLVQRALAILMIRPPLDVHISAGDAPFEYAPVEAVSGRTCRHFDRSIDHSSSLKIDQPIV